MPKSKRKRKTNSGLCNGCGTFQSNMSKHLKSNRLCVNVGNDPSYVTDFITRERQLQNQLLIPSNNHSTVHSIPFKKSRREYNNNDNLAKSNESSALHTNVDNCNNQKTSLLSYFNDIDFDVLASHSNDNYNNNDHTLYSSQTRKEKENENIRITTNESMNTINNSSIYQHDYDNLLENESELNIINTTSDTQTSKNDHCPSTNNLNNNSLVSLSANQPNDVTNNDTVNTLPIEIIPFTSTRNGMIQNTSLSIINNQTSATTTNQNNIYYNNDIQNINHYPAKDFRNIQSIIFKNRYIGLAIDNQTIASIKLLKMMIEGSFAQYHYADVVKWHEETNLLLTDTSSTSYTLSSKKSLCRDRSKVIELISNNLTNYKSEYSLKPKQTIIQLPSKRYTSINTFQIEAIIYSLFSIPEFMNNNNSLLYNKFYRNPMLLDELPDNERKFGDLHTGTAFRKAYQKLCSTPKDILIPIILFIDGTIVDAYGRLSLEGVLMTLGCFNAISRNKPNRWRLLGYIPDPCKEDSGNDSYCDTDKDRQAKRNDYHFMLRHILKGINELEQSDGIIWNLPTKDGTNIETVCFRFYLQLVIGDALGNDKLCDRFCSYGFKTKYLCRDCNCPTDQLDNPDYNCKFTLRSDILRMNEKELKELCYYKVIHNAFDMFHLGGDKTGIHGCTPSEILHQFLLGILKKLMTFVGTSLTNPVLKIIDTVIKYLSMNWNRQSSKDHPNIQMFKDGLEKSHMTGKEIIDQLFIVYLSLVQSYVMKTIPNVEQKSSSKSKKRRMKSTVQHTTNTSGELSRQEVVVEEKVLYPKLVKDLVSLRTLIKLFEFSLCLYEWLIQKEIPYSEVKLSDDYDNAEDGIDDSLAAKAINRYQKLYLKVVKEPFGNGNQTLKFHSSKHIPHYIRKFGVPSNYNGSIGEHHLKVKVKIPARLTQKRPSVLAKQASLREYEHTTIMTAYNLLVLKGDIHDSKFHNEQLHSPSTDDDVNSLSSSLDDMSLQAISSDNRDYWCRGRYTIFVDRNNNNDVVKVVSSYNSKKKILFNKLLMKDIIKRLMCVDYNLDSENIHCFSVLKFNDNKGVNRSKIALRADPDFHKKPWMDWCMIEWEDDEGSKTNYPGRVLMFIDAGRTKFKSNVVNDKGRLLAVIKSTAKDERCGQNGQRHNHQCNLIKTYKYESNIIRIVSCDSIVEDAFVVSDLQSITNDAGDVYRRRGRLFVADYVMRVIPRDQWANKIFSNFL